MDLVGLNINRGRDQGMFGYTKYAAWCTGIEVNSFGDLELVNRLPEDIEKVKNVFRLVFYLRFIVEFD